jgi:GNAT superfamily N-acetyltransferase
MTGQELSGEVRAASGGELAAVQRVVEAAYGPYQESIGVRPLPLDDDYAARLAAGQLWVLDGAAGLEGVLVLERRDGYLLVDNVAVDPALQHGGRGRRLLAFAEEQARRLGFGELRLYTNERMVENRRLYARLGYEEIARETIEGRHAVWMRKRLR